MTMEVLLFVKVRECLIGEMVDAAFFNTVVFFVYLLLIYKLAYGKVIDNSFLIFEYILLGFSLPGIGASVYLPECRVQSVSTE